MTSVFHVGQTVYFFGDYPDEDDHGIVEAVITRGGDLVAIEVNWRVAGEIHEEDAADPRIHLAPRGEA